MSNEQKSDKEKFIPINELFLKINGVDKRITSFNSLQKQVSTLLEEKNISEKQFKQIKCTVGMDFLNPYNDNFRGKTIIEIKKQLDRDEVDNNVDIFVNISNKETVILCLPKDQAIPAIKNIHVTGFLTHKGHEYSKEYADKKDYYLNNPEKQIKFGKIPILGIWTQQENILSSLKKNNIHILLKVENMTWNDVSPPYMGAHHTVKGGDDLYIVIPYKSEYTSEALKRIYGFEYTSKSLKRIYTSNISWKKIKNKRIKGIDFTGINLDNTVFENCEIDDCTLALIDCTIQNCTINNSRLTFINNCTLSESKLINCEMNDSIQYETIIFKCTFETVKFSAFIMIGMDLTTNIFKKCIFEHGVFNDCNLSNLNLSNTKFTDFSFQDSNMKNINVSNSKFYWCNLSGTDLTNADLTNTKFEGGLKEGIRHDAVNLDDAELAGAKLTGSNLNELLNL